MEISDQLDAAAAFALGKDRGTSSIGHSVGPRATLEGF